MEISSLTIGGAQQPFKSLSRQQVEEEATRNQRPLIL